MIELFEQNERKADRQSSKGNQLKWENDGIWYKADCTGYEGLAEYMVSHLLEKSSLGKNEFVQYDYEQIKYKNVFYNGVKSRNFLYDDWQIITLERLFQNFFQKSLYFFKNDAASMTENEKETKTPLTQAANGAMMRAESMQSGKLCGKQKEFRRKNR